MRYAYACLATLSFWVVGSAESEAHFIYTYETTLQLSSGTDIAGLNGATFSLSFEVASGSTYVDRLGFPAVPTSNEFLTISGASVAANNGVFAIEPLAFYPSFAGWFTEPGGGFLKFVLPLGGTLTMPGNTVPTAAGSGALVGDVVQLADFVPSSPLPGTTWITSDAAYSLTSSSITATQSTPEVPEPTSMVLAGIGLVGLIGVRRSARKRIPGSASVS